ncbi:recombinase family protein [Fusibacter ferrireducens]|uniref:Recombinase family protein n=1 Tax=Fusibacter ferrireducens TaxID=2785058 RepID=A0ABR9ZP51_9FIRM|nr:recombinase family protein [Fusibacter ferrireducens]MBF4692248.1 recombinase family protein [Fusibacter ferrireducens]
MARVKVIEASKQSRRQRNGFIENQLRIAAYCRVSTDSDEQKLSYQSQVLHYKQLVETKPEWELVDIYADEAISGTQINKRVDFQRMINDALEGKIDMIITKSISRFARNTLDTLKYVRLLKEKNVAIMFEKENINTLTMNGEMLLVILSSLAQQESESISANVTMGLKMKMKRGEMVGYNGCLGYDYDSETKTISINEEEADIVRYIFRRYVEGSGCFVIAKELSNLGYKTRRGSTKWHESTVRGIIKNEKYKGDLLQGKTFTVDPITHRRLDNMGEKEQFYVENNHDAIISDEMFERAQEILRMRSKKHSKKNTSRMYSRKHAFSSLCTCGFCGSTYIRRIWHHGTDHEKPAWQCGKAIKQGRKTCGHSKGIHESFLEDAFVNAYNKVQELNSTDIEEFFSNIEEALDVSHLRSEISELSAKIKKLEYKSQTLLDMRLDEKITEADYDKKYNDIEAELNAHSEERNEKYEALQGEESITTRINEFRKVFAEEIEIRGFDRDIMESLIDKIVIGSTDEEGNPNPYVVTFVFKAGMKFNEEFYKKVANSSAIIEEDNLSTYATNEKQLACTYAPNKACGVRGEAGKTIKTSNINGLIH